MKTVHTGAAPKAIGPYSQATVSGGFVFCSGQVPIDPATGELVAGGMREQMEQVLQNLKAVLEAAGTDLSRVVSVTVYVKSLDDFKILNEVYEAAFGAHKPARATVGVSELPKSALVEISCIAEK